MFEKRKIRKAFELITQIAFSTRVAELEKLLDNGVDANARMQIKGAEYSLVDWAIKSGRQEYVQVLLDSDAKLRGDILGYMLENCSASKSKDMFDFLINYGVDLKAYDEKLLLKAIRKSHKEVFEYLVRSGFKVTDTEQDGVGAVIEALASYDKEMIETVLSHKPNLNGKYRGYTPLERAIRSYDTNIIGKILDAGADPNLPIDDHPNAYDFAAKRSAEILQFLYEYKARRAELDFREWVLTGASEVTRRTKQPDTGYSRTEIFNFAGAYTQINHNLESGVPSAAVMPIDSLRGTEMFRQAAAELTALGGKMPENAQMIPVVTGKARGLEK